MFLAKNMQRWLDAAETIDRKRLTELVSFNLVYLYQIAKGVVTPSADWAASVEPAFLELAKGTNGRLPKLTRAHISPTCAACPYAQRCLKLEPVGEETKTNG